MVLNIVQSLFRWLGGDVPHKQKCRDGMRRINGSRNEHVEKVTTVRN
jgi:hypothetical protein